MQKCLLIPSLLGLQQRSTSVLSELLRHSPCRIKPTPKRSNLRIELCLWIYTIYPLLQCQSSSGSVDKSIWPPFRRSRFKSCLDLFDSVHSSNYEWCGHKWEFKYHWSTTHRATPCLSHTCAHSNGLPKHLEGSHCYHKSKMSNLQLIELQGPFSISYISLIKSSWQLSQCKQCVLLNGRRCLSWATSQRWYSPGQ